MSGNKRPYLVFRDRSSPCYFLVLPTYRRFGQCDYTIVPVIYFASGWVWTHDPLATQ